MAGNYLSPNAPMTPAEKDAAIMTVRQIQMMMTSPGWQALMEMWRWKRIEIELKGKRAKKEESSLGFWKMLDGFDMAVNLATDAVYRHEREAQMEEAVESAPQFAGITGE